MLVSSGTNQKSPCTNTVSLALESLWREWMMETSSLCWNKRGDNHSIQLYNTVVLISCIKGNPNRWRIMVVGMEFLKYYTHRSILFDFWSRLSKIDVWKSRKHGRSWALPFWASVWTPWRRLACVAAVCHTSWSNLFLLFIGKERTNMATPGRTEPQS